MKARVDVLQGFYSKGNPEAASDSPVRVLGTTGTALSNFWMLFSHVQMVHLLIKGYFYFNA